MDKEEALQIQLSQGREAKEYLQIIQPFLERKRKEIHSKLEDCDNNDETRLKYHLVALRDIENDLCNSVKSACMAKAEMGGECNG